MVGGDALRGLCGDDIPLFFLLLRLKSLHLHGRVFGQLALNGNRPLITSETMMCVGRNSLRHEPLSVLELVVLQSHIFLLAA